ncbi:MBL fold metallo-hydrolase [Galactobacter valiniphilus]|uniref:MBL fold metallo-hydrolase n=1 Tax=Galactobacter valiniphilus TaxID=2676122 RepID=UPI0037359477
MILKQYYLGCLSHASYLVADEATGRAVIVDPRRDVDEYLADAMELGLTIEGVFNTHFHADFVAGHLELQAATGAWIGYGPQADPQYAHRAFADGERLALGDPATGLVVEAVHTPGHTWESTSLLLRPAGADSAVEAVLTGDTLFIGDVGRPDLAAAVGADPLELAHAQHASVARLMALPDAVRVLPAHGAGSACGKNLSTELESTIGAQRLMNPLARELPVEEFVAILTSGQPAIPAYFGEDAVLNRAERALFDADGVPAGLSAAEALAARAAGSLLIDTRSPEDFGAGHALGSLNVGLGGRFAETLGMVAPLGASVVFVSASFADAEEARVRAARIGLDGGNGFLLLDDAARLALQGAGEWGVATRLEPLAAEAAVASGALYLDVRNPGEVASGAMPGSLRIPLAELPGRLAEVPADLDLVVHCAGGWRSSVAASVLRAAGYERVSDVLGGFGALSVAVPGRVEVPVAAA